ncbi:MAG: NADH-quinone oxidoreductase subunit G [Betaproteobacteria bacterium]|nr:NADH-quinone oxidoreductase subunit G [Betaproteobacteria bacterium]
MSAPLAKVEIDGKHVEVPLGSMVMEAANKLGLYVPHFCYHSKLTIVANCRMCLVEIEKAPKPMPACATPVSDGMKIHTQSTRAKQAQNGVMELLLINHPLDCPICDQGGECQLQDLAVGYGGSGSRFEEDKRVVPRKDLGPLVAAEEMSRCIQCTRCVRFGQEIAGVMELGMIGRGEHAEIVSFVGKSVDSELSGNMIDICPVGALTSKPFRYSARTWELSRRKTIAPHDSLGSNLVVQVKQNRVMRVLPLENDDVNECWISDRDRFSYEALNSDQRLAKPLVREGNGWREVDWQVALKLVAERWQKIATEQGAKAIGALASPSATLEEMHLLGKVMRGLGSENIDFRLRQRDFSATGKAAGAPWLGMKVSEIADLDAVLVVGSFLRKDHPLLASRFRQAAKRGQQLHLLHIASDEPLIDRVNRVVVAPSELPHTLASIARALCEAKEQTIPEGLREVAVTEVARNVARSLARGKKIGVFLGNTAQQHDSAVQLHVLAQMIAGACSGRLGFFGEAANSVGGYLAGCVPGPGGLNAYDMLAQPRSAYLLLNCEPELDSHNGRQAAAALRTAQFVVAMTPFQTAATEYAHVILPVTPFTETSGTFVNTEGRMQSFNAVVRPLGEARPAWKVLRVLGNMLGLSGFDHETSEAVRNEVGHADALAARLSNAITDASLKLTHGPALSNGALERVTDVPIYCTDGLVRRAPSLQQTADARVPCALMPLATMQKLGLSAGAKVRLKQEGGEATLEVALEEALAPNCIRVAAGHSLTAALGAMSGTITVERVG